MNCGQKSSRHEAVRGGFTVLEAMIAIGILSVALLLVVQVGLFSWRQRAHGALRLEALETAANLLETARAQNWEALTPAWGAAQQLPDPLRSRLVTPRLTVRVEPEAGRPRVKRVTVEIEGKMDTGDRLSSVRLVGLLSARTATEGEKP
jgi:type II secretory pathway pseudopilin PulG